MSVRFNGNWHGFRRRMQSAQDWITGPSQELLFQLGLGINREITREISKVGPGNAPRTIELKGFDQPYVNTGWLVAAGLKTPKVQPKGLGRTSLVMAVGDVLHPNGIPASTLFRWLEYGTYNIPPRPVFGPVQKQLEAGTLPAYKVFRERYANAIRSSIS